MSRLELAVPEAPFRVPWGVFLDRDGTVTEEVGYVNHPSRLRLVPGAAEAIRALNLAGVPVILATNQAGVARGYFTEEVLREALGRLVRMLGALGARLDAVYYCPHHPSAGAPPYRRDCPCRKPRPGLLEEARGDLGLELGRSFVVGDKDTDIALAKAVGGRGILTLTGYGLGEVTFRRGDWVVQPDFVAADLPEAVRWILGGAGA